MFIKIYIGNKPVFLCDATDNTISAYMHHPDTILLDEISNAAIKSLLHEIIKPEFHAGILLYKDLEKLKRSFFRHFNVIQAAGGVITNAREEVLLIFRRGKWDLPKGKLDKDETLEECALREVEEETGLKGIDLGKFCTVTYHVYHEFGKQNLKESHWYRMRYNGNEKPVPQTEEDITEIRWVAITDLAEYTNNTYATIIDVLYLLKNQVSLSK